ncbi:hypothetical protein GCM10027020_35170 [Nocardioides salsibiostraticola]
MTTQPSGTASKRVVIIDDTEDLRELLKLALGRGGFDVVAEAGDGKAGIEVVRDARPDVILIDLAMPVMDGIEALPTLRRLCPAAKIVVLSGFGAQQMSARALAAGADGYVQKGAPLNTILQYVRDITSGQGHRPGSRKLSVVPTSSAPAAETLQERPAEFTPPAVGPLAHSHPDPQPTPTATSPMTAARGHDHVSAWEALGLAPYGVIEVADEPLFRLVHINGVAARLLGTETAGAPLSTVAPELSTMVAFHRLDPDASFEVDLPHARARATLRRTGWSVLIYLDAAAEDVGMLRRAIATTAHEIRGPVAVLCGIAETIGWSAQTITSEQRDRLMASVGRQARMLDSITADLLTAAQIQRGTLRIDLQVVDPATIVESAISDRYDVSVEVEDSRQVRADPLRLEQILTNLLSNAHKYGAAPYSITVRGEGDSVCIEVRDEGAGVPLEFADNLFKEFSRAPDAVATGTGLGLYVVKTLAEAQSGSVSYHPGEEAGSVFVVKMLAC